MAPLVQPTQQGYRYVGDGPVNGSDPRGNIGEPGDPCRLQCARPRKALPVAHRPAPQPDHRLRVCNQHRALPSALVGELKVTDRESADQCQIGPDRPLERPRLVAARSFVHLARVAARATSMVENARLSPSRGGQGTHCCPALGRAQVAESKGRRPARGVNRSRTPQAASSPIYGLAIGSRTSKQDPSAVEVTTRTSPPWTSTIRRTIARPRPDPGTLRSVEPR